MIGSGFDPHTKYEMRLENYEARLVDLPDYYKYMDMDLIYSEFDGDEIDEMKDSDIIRVNHERDMIEIVEFEL